MGVFSTVVSLTDEDESLFSRIERLMFDCTGIAGIWIGMFACCLCQKVSDERTLIQ